MRNEIITCFLSPFDVEAKSKVAGGDEFQMLILQAGKHLPFRKLVQHSLPMVIILICAKETLKKLTLTKP